MLKMKTKVYLLLLISFGMNLLSAQEVFGKWVTIDDETGEKKSIVEIYEENGKVFIGKTSDSLAGSHPK